jgi:hypothetical protein
MSAQGYAMVRGTITGNKQRGKIEFLLFSLINYSHVSSVYVISNEKLYPKTYIHSSVRDWSMGLR